MNVVSPFLRAVLWLAGYGVNRGKQLGEARISVRYSVQPYRRPLRIALLSPLPPRPTRRQPRAPPAAIHSKRTPYSSLPVSRHVRQHFCRIVRVSLAIPSQQRLRGVAIRSQQFLSQDPATDAQPVRRIANRRQVQGTHALLPRYLPHHLHQAPRNPARIRFRGAHLIICIQRRNVLREEQRFIPDRPRIPVRDSCSTTAHTSAGSNPSSSARRANSTKFLSTTIPPFPSPTIHFVALPMITVGAPPFASLLYAKGGLLLSNDEHLILLRKFPDL